MDSIRPRATLLAGTISLLLCALTLLDAAPARAQTAQVESRLPADTVFYFSWRGTKALDATKSNNSLLRMWNDPDFTNVRAAVMAQAFSANPVKKVEFTGEDAKSLLENSLVMAFVKLPPAGLAAARKKDPKADSVEGIFIYDRTGKQELIDRLMLHALGERPAPTVTKKTTHGVEIETLEWPKSTLYRAVAGPYLLVSPNAELLEGFVSRMSAPDDPADSLLKTSENRAARAQMDPEAAFSLFVNLPVMIQETSGKSPDPKQAQALKALHFDRLHSLSMSINMSSPATRFRMTMLGDLSPGTLLDMFGRSSGEFSTLAGAPATSASFTAMRLDMSAAYKAIRTAITSTLPPEQAQNIDSVESAVAAQLGMSVQEVMSLLSGEFAMVDPEPASPFNEKIYLMGIDKPDDFLHMVRAMLTTTIYNEEESGPVTYLALKTTEKSKTGTSQRAHFYYLAVGPHLAVVAPRKALARETMARFTTPGHAGSLAMDAKFLTARARLPKELSSIGYSDFTRVDWAKAFNFLESAGELNPQAKQLATLLKAVAPGLLSRYLHGTVGGWWRDQRGLYFDGYLE
jgi:hypothetical protein